MSEQSLKADWLTVIDGNCEQKIWGNSEYISSITAIFIGFIGGYGVLHHQYITPLWKILWWMFVMNGFGSAMFHWTLKLGWDLIDSMTMIIAVILASYKTVHMLVLDKYFVIDNNIKTRRDFCLYNTISALNNFIHLAVLLFFLAGDALSKESVSSVALVCFGTILFVGCLVAFRVLYAKKNESFDNYTTTNVIWSFIFIVAGTAIRFAAELGCDYHPIFKYSFGHAIWHIVCALGLYRLTIALMYIDAFNMQCKPFWEIKKFHQKILPVLRIKKFEPTYTLAFKYTFFLNTDEINIEMGKLNTGHVKTQSVQEREVIVDEDAPVVVCRCCLYR